MTSTDCPQILDSKEIFHGRVFDVTVDTIREADKTYQRETVHHPGSAVIVPVFEDGTLALVRQKVRLVSWKKNLATPQSVWRNYRNSSSPRVFAKRKCGFIWPPT